MRMTTSDGGCGVRLTVLLLSVCYIQGRSINTFAGPFIMIIHRVSACPSDGTAALNLRVSHFNPVRPFDLQSLTGNLTMKRPLADNIWVAAVLDIWANNQWKENAFILKFPHASCALGRDIAPSLFQFLGRISGAPMDKKSPCVVPAGSYAFENETVKWEFPQFKVMPYGRYRLHLRMGRQGNAATRFCSVCDVEYVPQP